MNFFRRIFSGTIGTINVIFLLLFLMAAFSDRISPEKSTFFAYLGLGFPILFFINLLFLIYYAFTQNWKMILVGLVVMLISGPSLANNFGLHLRKKPENRENTIKILSYNIMSFAYKDHTTEEPNEIIQYIIDSDADIVCLQEGLFGQNQQTFKKNKYYLALSAVYPYHSIMPLKGHHYNCLAVFSRFPIKSSRWIEYESKHNGSSLHILDVNGKSLALVNNHLESFKLTIEDKSKYTDLIKNLSMQAFDEFKGTIPQKLGNAFRIRARQADILAEEISNLQTDYTIVCGDFNDTPVSYAHRTIQGSLRDAFSDSGFGIGITYNQNFFWFRIDHILYSPNMRAIGCKVDKVRYSDHYPIWCYLEMNGSSDSSNAPK